MLVAQNKFCISEPELLKGCKRFRDVERLYQAIMRNNLELRDHQSAPSSKQR
jgi:hypothetical protein